MAKLPISELSERMNVAIEMLQEAYPDNPAVEQVVEAIQVASQVVLHMAIPFSVVEEWIDTKQ